MVLSYNASLENLILAVTNIRKKLNIKIQDYPIDIYSVIDEYKYLTIVEEKFESTGLCGFLIRNKEPDASIIVINSNLTPCDKNFAICHEIIHYFCHPIENENKMFSASHKKHIKSPREQQANEGAAELLIPAELFVPEFKTAMEFYGSFNNACVETAKAYNIAPEVVKYRCKNLDIKY